MNKRILFVRANATLRDAKITGIRDFRHIFGTGLTLGKELVEKMIDGEMVNICVSENMFMETTFAYLNHKPTGWYIARVENFDAPAFDLTLI